MIRGKPIPVSCFFSFGFSVNYYFLDARIFTRIVLGFEVYCDAFICPVFTEIKFIVNYFRRLFIDQNDFCYVL